MMKSNLFHLFAMLSLLISSDYLHAQRLIIFPEIPGRTPSDKYMCRGNVIVVTQSSQINAIFSPLTNSSPGLKNSIHVYPNPVTDRLFVNAASKAINKIQLIDLTGKVVYTDNEVNLNKSIDTSRFITGLYILQIHSSNHVFTTKVMKNNYTYYI